MMDMKRAEKVADKGGACARAKSILNFSNGDGDVKRASERVPPFPSAALPLSLSPFVDGENPIRGHVCW